MNKFAESQAAVHMMISWIITLLSIPANVLWPAASSLKQCPKENEWQWGEIQENACCWLSCDFLVENICIFQMSMLHTSYLGTSGNVIWSAANNVSLASEEVSQDGGGVNIRLKFCNEEAFAFNLFQTSINNLKVFINLHIDYFLWLNYQDKSAASDLTSNPARSPAQVKYSWRLDAHIWSSKSITK